MNITIPTTDRTPENTKLWKTTRQLAQVVKDITGEALVLVYHRAVTMYLEQAREAYDTKAPGFILVNTKQVTIVDKSGTIEVINESPEVALPKIIPEHPTFRVIDLIRY